MAANMIKSRLSRNKVPLNMYMSWKLYMSFVVDVEDIENCRTVRKIYCSCCRKHVDKIRLDSRL